VSVTAEVGINSTVGTSVKVEVGSGVDVSVAGTDVASAPQAVKRKVSRLKTIKAVRVILSPKIRIR
jgi:hypothetical protein